MFFVLFNFAYAPWSWNPIEDLLYVRSAGYILAANHISSAIPLAATALILAINDSKKAYKVMFVIFSTASIHEYTLDGFNLLTGFVRIGWLSYVLTFRWFFWLGFFLVPGVILATKRQRKVLLYMAVFDLVYIAAWYFIALYFGINTYTIQGYAPGPAYHDFIPNFFEVTGWVIPTSFWWFEGLRVKRAQAEAGHEAVGSKLRGT